MQALIQHWKQNFVYCSIVHCINNNHVVLDKRKASALFESNGESQVQIDCNHLKYLFGGFRHVDGLNIAKEYCIVLNVLGIDLAADEIIAIAGEGESFVCNFVKKVWYIVRDIEAYDGRHINDVYENNKGDLQFFAHIKQFIQPFDEYNAIYNKHTPESFCLFSVSKQELKYHVYIFRDGPNYFLSLKYSKNIAELFDLDFPDYMVNKKTYQSINDVIVTLMSNFISNGYQEHKII